LEENSLEENEHTHRCIYTVVHKKRATLFLTITYFLTFVVLIALVAFVVYDVWPWPKSQGHNLGSLVNVVYLQIYVLLPSSEYLQTNRNVSRMPTMGHKRQWNGARK